MNVIHCIFKGERGLSYGEWGKGKRRDGQILREKEK